MRQKETNREKREGGSTIESKPRREIDRIGSSRSSRETERVAETERDNLEQGLGKWLRLWSP